MGIQFATCDRSRAFQFIRDSHPKLADVTEDEVAALLDLIEADVIRIQDPAMHSPAAIIPSENWSEDRREEVMAACQPLADKKAAA